MKMEITFKKEISEDVLGIAVYNLMCNIKDIMHNLYIDWKIEKIDIKDLHDIVEISVLLERNC